MKLGPRTNGNASCKLSVPVALPLPMRANIIELSAMHTLPANRNKGEATELLLDVCLEADMQRKFLFLAVKPDKDCPLSTTQLANFYSRFGFLPIQTEPLLMTRPYVGALAHA